MLNMYFVFGVPIFLLFLYATIAYVRKRTTIHYLGFILLIISGFMLVFNLQTWQQALLEMDKMTPHALSKVLGYPVYLIWLPIFISGYLVLLNIYLLTFLPRTPHLNKIFCLAEKCSSNKIRMF